METSEQSQQAQQAQQQAQQAQQAQAQPQQQRRRSERRARQRLQREERQRQQRQRNIQQQQAMIAPLPQNSDQNGSQNDQNGQQQQQQQQPPPPPPLLLPAPAPQNVPSRSSISSRPRSIQMEVEVEEQQVEQPPQPNSNSEEEKQGEMQLNKPVVFQNSVRLGGQQQPGFKNLPVQRFIAKIPNVKVLRDFLINTGHYYCPPIKDMTNCFSRKILGGEKKLLKVKDVLFVDQIPNWPEFSAKQVYAKARNNPNHSLYLPDFKGSRVPQRRYLLNIVNTVDKNSVIQAVFNIRKDRQANNKAEEPIKLTSEFAELLSGFVSVSSDQKRKGLRLKNPKQHDQCPLCMQIMIKINACSNFACLRHKGHKNCIMKYMRSENGRRAMTKGYLCPMRCNQPS